MEEKLNVLVVGGGGREHALVWKLKQSPRVKKIYCAPGNAGIAQLADCVTIAAEDIQGLLHFAEQASIDLTVVGPEAPLVAGIVDTFEQAGRRIFGPSQKAALLEGSKALAKEIMVKYGIPTARHATFSTAEAAYAYIQEQGAPCVVKADGLAAGKGVVVAMDEETALAAVKEIMENRAFGEAGNQVVIEEYLEGEEVSILAFTDGQTVVPMVSAQDHKRVFDGDRGPNTGGMGAYSPAPVYNPGVAQQVVKQILEPTVAAMRTERREYRGVLYAGLMITANGPKVLEFNARFGDPETQVVLPRLKTDLVDIIEAILDQRLEQLKIEWYPQTAVCVVLAAGGYPGSYQKGMVIEGLDRLTQEVLVFHAGTTRRDGRIVTNGGRVLGVTALGDTIQTAIDRAYAAVEQIKFADMHYRRDIGYRALQRR
ncbi:MAG: phosphoribosylamine--glycine ligase [Firmicutes bacterium]|nr:phosphoribosylamine--glycine ligase [Bacillota bacterium]